MESHDALPAELRLEYGRTAHAALPEWAWWLCVLAITWATYVTTLVVLVALSGWDFRVPG